MGCCDRAALDVVYCDPMSQTTERVHVDERRQWIRLLPLVGIAAVSTILAVEQQRSPGDHPFPLLAYGCILSALASVLRLGPPVLVGLAAMAGFPIGATIDLILEGGHTMLPFEFVFYAIYAVVGVVVAIIGDWVGRAIARL